MVSISRSELQASAYVRQLAKIATDWEEFGGRAPLRRAPSFSSRGLILGSETVLARAVEGHERRILALLRIAFDRPIPDRVIETLKLAETAFAVGDATKSAMLIALSAIPARIERDEARRLWIGAALADRQLLSLAEIEDLANGAAQAEKYAPDQPRIPAGNAGGGQWAGDESFETASAREPLGLDRTAGLRGCTKERREAREFCASLLRLPNPARGLTGGYDNVEDCSRGFVSERCGGNKVMV